MQSVRLFIGFTLFFYVLFYRLNIFARNICIIPFAPERAVFVCKFYVALFPMYHSRTLSF